MESSLFILFFFCSRAIAQYLCNRYEKGEDSTRLYPIDPQARGVVDQLLYVSEQIDDTVKMHVVSKFPKQKK